MKIFLVALLVISIVIGCNKKVKEPVRDTYRMPLADKVQTLNPRELRALHDDQILKAIFDLLIVTDNDGYLKPSICYRWEISQDFKEYTFFIRNDIVFHDGLPLTARDVLFSLEYEGRKPTLLHKIFMPIEGYDEYYQGRAFNINGIEVLDDYTIKIKLNKPLATFLYTLANSKLVILPLDFHGADEKSFFKQPIGTGQYKFERWNGNELSLVVNDKYFDDKGSIKRFIFTAMGKAEAINAFEKHEVDDLVLYKLTPSEIKRTDINIFKGTAFATQLIFFNVKKPPLDNMYLRLAIRAAIDKRKLIMRCYPNDEVATGIIPKGLVGALDDEHMFDDLNKSVDYYLSKAGMSRRNLPKMIIMRLKEVEDDCFKPTVESMFKTAGLPIEVEVLTFEDCVKRIEHNDYYLLSEWLAARNVEPINIINFFDGRSTHNLSNMNDKEINKLIDDAELARTRSERGKIYRQISEMIIRKAYAVDVQFENRYYLYDNSIHGIINPSPMRYFLRLGELSFANH